MATVLDEGTQYVDEGGKPLVGGSIYIGDVDTDPVANPLSIFSDRELTVALANPQTLDANGRSTNKIWLAGRYSLQVNDIDDVQVFQDLDRGDTSSDASGVIVLGSVLGADIITAQATPTITEYVDKQLFTFTVAENNTDNVTLNIDSLGAIAVRKNQLLGLRQDYLIAGETILLQYSSGQNNFIIINQKTNLSAYILTTASTNINKTELGCLFDCTTDVTLSPVDPINFGDGFTFYVKANGGVVTIDPSNSNIDGESTIDIADGGYVMITTDGVNFFTAMAGRFPIEETFLYSIQVFTSSGTWTKPDGVEQIKVTVIGGGGGGGSSNTVGEVGAGGAGGGTAISMISVGLIDDRDITIGAGGAGAVSGTGGSGGETTFGVGGSLVAANGGGGGNGTTGQDAGGAGASGTTGDLLLKGQGGQGTSGGNEAGGLGGSSSLGGGGRGNIGTGGDGGDYGGGGSGGYGENDGRDGADGVVIVEEFYR